SGGIGKTVEAGVKALIDLLPVASEVKRVELPAKHIMLGTNCGGSDGNSGVTANPALGVASDLIVQQGGTSILGETSEIYGAEHLLTRRAVSRAVGEKLVERIKWWEWYAGIFGAEINNNPSVGNKEGGLTTIYEKSLGAIAMDAGVILNGAPVEEVGRRIFEEILAVASGKKTKSEVNGVGEEEFAPWAIGPTL